MHRSCVRCDPGEVTVVRCAGCNADLTLHLSHQVENLQKGGVPVARGRWAVDPSPLTVEVWHRGMPAGQMVTEEEDPPGAIVVHPDDRLPSALLDVEGRSGGCCGLAGDDGPNQQCAACGAVVGTARTDCWTATEMRFWPDRVRVTHRS